MTPANEDITAYDVAAVTLHWMACQWSRASPGVALRLRSIADRLSDKAGALRKRELEAALSSEDPLDPEEPTERVTTPYGSKPGQ